MSHSLEGLPLGVQIWMTLQVVPCIYLASQCAHWLDIYAAQEQIIALNVSLGPAATGADWWFSNWWGADWRFSNGWGADWWGLPAAVVSPTATVVLTHQQWAVAAALAWASRTGVQLWQHRPELLIEEMGINVAQTVYPPRILVCSPSRGCCVCTY